MWCSPFLVVEGTAFVDMAVVVADMKAVAAEEKSEAEDGKIRLGPRSP